MMTESLAYPGDTRRLSVGEEVLNAVSHGVGALLAVAGTVLLVLRAKAYGGSFPACTMPCRRRRGSRCFKYWTTAPFSC